MKKSIVACVAAGVLVFAACGSDSDESGDTSDATVVSDSGGSDSVVSDSGGSDSGGAGGARAEVADDAIEAAGEAGVALDEECVKDLASRLSDEDAEAIAAAGPDGDAEISDEGTAIGAQLMSCADQEEIVDLFIEQMENSGQDFDEACVREGLEGVDLSELAANPEGGMPEELVSALVECVELGS